MKQKFIDPAHPFYKPLWRRIVIVAVCASWFVMEAVVLKEPLWALLSGAMGAYAAWVLLWTWRGEDI